MWEDLDDELDIDLFNDEATSASTASSTPHSSLIMWLVFLIAQIQKKHFIPNAAVSLILKLLSVVFFILGKLHPELADISIMFPATLHSMNKLLDVKTHSFKKYVSCPVCHTLYTYDECVWMSQQGNGACCTNKRSGRSVCKSPLVKRVQTTTGRQLLYPIKYFCYMPLRLSLQKLLDTPEFLDSCEQWRTRNPTQGVLSDVYDGKIWQDFQSLNGLPFLSAPYTYGLMMNIDWFKPFKHLEYSVGAIYLTVMNLPRAVRFKQENVLLVGIIPGPREPALSINSYLTPLIDELLSFLKGVQMNVHGKGVRTVRCALLCLACDTPACRKAAGFLSHSATLGCSKCLKKFPGPVGCKDYSGFDRSLWPPRSNDQHRKDVETIQRSSTKTEREQQESLHGCRYSVLLDLPYFDPVRMCIIDPMHNLYLGSTKHILKRVWLEQDKLTSREFSAIQHTVDSVVVPVSVGRIPYKIFSSFSSFTADQFKNWTNIFSLFALRDRLCTEDLECWRHFVLASRLLTQVQLSSSDLQLADAFLLQFCRRVERMYGASVITPNMHLHCHIRQCVEDYGPVYNFWLFSYERYNGILESFPFSNRSVELQIMQRFVKEFYVCATNVPERFQDDFSGLIRTLLLPSLRGSVRCTFYPSCLSNSLQDWSLDSIDVELPKSYSLSTFDRNDISDIQSLLKCVFPTLPPDEITINSTFRKHRILNYRGDKYMSSAYKQSTCIALAQHCFDTPSTTIRPVEVHFFASMSFYHTGQHHELLLVRVSWLKEHHAKEAYGKPLEVWWKDLFEYDMLSFIPIQCVVGHCAHLDIMHEGQGVLMLCSLKNIKIF